ncbi:hypothetical protein ACS0TY_013421 [Phlomoides rotata]
MDVLDKEMDEARGAVYDGNSDELQFQIDLMHDGLGNRIRHYDFRVLFSFIFSFDWILIHASGRLTTIAIDFFHRKLLISPHRPQGAIKNEEVLFRLPVPPPPPHRPLHLHPEEKKRHDEECRQLRELVQDLENGNYI